MTWAWVGLLVGAASPADVVVARMGATTITAHQLTALVDTLPAEQRAGAGANPAALAELLRGALVQSTVFDRAHAAGWDTRPDVMAQAERARKAAIGHSFILSRLPPLPPPTDAQIRDAYTANKAHFMVPRQFHLQQIFAAVPAGAPTALSEQQRARLADLQTRLLRDPSGFDAAGRSFTANAAGHAANSDLGWIREDMLTQPIRATVLGMQEGTVSPPLRTADGWHLIGLIATRPAAPASLDQARPMLIQALTRQHTEAATHAYLDTLLAQTPVEINQTALTAIAQNAH